MAKASSHLTHHEMYFTSQREKGRELHNSVTWATPAIHIAYIYSPFANSISLSTFLSTHSLYWFHFSPMVNIPWFLICWYLCCISYLKNLYSVTCACKWLTNASTTSMYIWPSNKRTYVHKHHYLYFQKTVYKMYLCEGSVEAAFMFWSFIFISVCCTYIIWEVLL